MDFNVFYKFVGPFRTKNLTFENQGPKPSSGVSRIIDFRRRNLILYIMPVFVPNYRKVPSKPTYNEEFPDMLNIQKNSEHIYSFTFF